LSGHLANNYVDSNVVLFIIITKEELENKYPAGSMVDLLGSKYQGKVVGNFRLMHLKEDLLRGSTRTPDPKSDPELKEWMTHFKNQEPKNSSGEWFVDVEVLGEVKPLNIMMLC